MSISNPAAYATFLDPWAGAVTVALVPFRTKRNGQTVTRYRWQTASGKSVGGYRAPFVTVEYALRAIQHHACFSNGRLV